MKPLFAAVAIFLSLSLFAQKPLHGNLTIFSDQGDKFFLYLNGEKKNEVAQSRVKVEGLTLLAYNVKIVYQDASSFTITKNNVFISDGDDNLMDVVYKIVRNGGNAKLKFYSMNPVSDKPAADSTKTPAIQIGEPTGSLQIFSEQKEPFYLFIDGEKQNEIAQTNIRVNSLSKLFYNVKVVYKDSRINPVSRNNVAVSDGDDNLMDATYRISRTSWYGKLKFYAMNAINPGYVPGPGVYVHQFGSTAASGTMVAINNPPVKEKDKPAMVSVTNKPEQKNEAAVKPASKPKPVEAKKEIAKKENTRTNDVAKKENAKPATQSNTSKATPGKSIAVNNSSVAATPDPIAAKNNFSVKEPEGWVCRNEWPMWKVDYANAKKDIAEAKTEKQKLAAAKELVSKHCLNCEQVAEVGMLFSSEETRLEFAKYAFSHTIDIKNYFKVIRIFSSLKSKEQLTSFVGG